MAVKKRTITKQERKSKKLSPKTSKSGKITKTKSTRKSTKPTSHQTIKTKVTPARPVKASTELDNGTCSFITSMPRKAASPLMNKKKTDLQSIDSRENSSYQTSSVKEPCDSVIDKSSEMDLESPASIVPSVEPTLAGGSEVSVPDTSDLTSIHQTQSSFFKTIFSPAFNFLRRKVSFGLKPETSTQEIHFDYSRGSTPSITEVENESNTSHHSHLGPSDQSNQLVLNFSTDNLNDFEDSLEDYLEDEFNPYYFIATLPPLPREFVLRPYALPRKTRSSPPITLVLDLDETLVHCSTSPLENADYMFLVQVNSETYEVWCRIRPYCLEFLENVSKYFEVVLFTASQKMYADKLLNFIDPKRKCIKYRLFRDSCAYVSGNYLKDLGILGRDLSQVVIVDNAPQAFAYQIGNGVPIESWYDDPRDQELVNTFEFLHSLIGVEDVRPFIENRFRTRDKVVRHSQRIQRNIFS